MISLNTVALAASLHTLLQLAAAAPILDIQAADAPAPPLNTTEIAELRSRAPWPKRGLPFNDANCIRNFNGQGSQVNWAYSWGSRMPDDFPSDYLEFNPMLWGTGADKTDPWFENAHNALSRGSGHLLAFNEPDRCDQACLSPQQAVDAFHRYLMPFAGRAELGSPAVTSQDGVGLPWLQEFIDKCDGCKIDFVAVHWYGHHTHIDHFFWFVQQARDVAQGRKLWITEFRAEGSVQERIEFLRKVMPWLDNQPYVYRYSWFWADPNSGEGTLVKHDGWPSDLGNVYTYTPYGHL